MFSTGRAAGIASTLVLLCACEGAFPADPEGTTERVRRSGVLRVGLTEHPPWVERNEGPEASGIEVEMVRRLAAQRGVRVDFRWGQQERLFAALARFELDLVIGGVDAKTTWSDRIGLTRPWYQPDDAEARQRPLALAVPPGENRWLVEVERFLVGHRPGAEAPP